MYLDRKATSLKINCLRVVDDLQWGLGHSRLGQETAGNFLEMSEVRDYRRRQPESQSKEAKSSAIRSSKNGDRVRVTRVLEKPNDLGRAPNNGSATGLETINSLMMTGGHGQPAAADHKGVAVRDLPVSRKLHELVEIQGQTNRHRHRGGTAAPTRETRSGSCPRLNPLRCRAQRSSSSCASTITFLVPITISTPTEDFATANATL